MFRDYIDHTCARILSICQFGRPASGFLVASHENVRTRWRRYLDCSACRDNCPSDSLAVVARWQTDWTGAEVQSLRAFWSNEEVEVPDRLRTVLPVTVVGRRVPCTQGQNVDELRTTQIVHVTHVERTDTTQVIV